jgi:hypothetical protein
VRFILLGVGAMNSPRYAPAGLLVEHGDIRVMIDGGPGAEPPGTIDAWLVTDDRGELIRQIRQLARARGLTPEVARFHRDGLVISPEPVVHTSHPTYGYLIAAEGRKVVWAPEFLEFPRWAEGADVMFAEAAGWNRPIRFARGAGGHAAALQVAPRGARTRCPQASVCSYWTPNHQSPRRWPAPAFWRDRPRWCCVHRDWQSTLMRPCMT